jgi:hypothetical protein
MTSCNYIKRLIDEADKSDVLSFEVNEHIGHCGDCESFANDRATLRNLLASERRVSAPMNFDAMLKARLVEVNGRSAFSRLSVPGFLRLGAATAGLVIMFFAAQYAGLFSNHSGDNPTPQSVAIAPAPNTVEPGRSQSIPTAPPITLVPSGVRDPQNAVRRSAGIRPSNYTAGRMRKAPDGYFTAEDGGVLLVRGRNGEMDVPMPTVSVGAQPMLYVSAGQRATRAAATSF